MTELVKEGSLGSILCRSKLVSEDDIAAALAEQMATGCRIGEALIKLGVVTQEDIDWALSTQLNIPYVRLKKELVDRAAVELVPASLARHHGLLPIIRSGDELSVAMTDPLDGEAVAAVEKLTGCRVTVSVALLREMREMHEFFYGPPDATETLGFVSRQFPEQAMAKMNNDLTGATFVDYLLLYLLQNRLVALSLQPVRDQVRVMARKAGSVREVGRLSLERFDAVRGRVRRLSGLGSGADNDKGTLTFHYRGKELLFQVLTLRCQGGECLTFKFHILSPFPSTLEQFGSEARKRDDFHSLAALGRGLVLFSVRDVEERSRLIDLFLESKDTREKSVLLLGDGVGRGRKGFPRISTHGVTPAEFHSLLMAALDHEPDILVIEDASDSQVFMAAGKAAMRGKLVLAGLAFSDLAALFRHLLYFWHRHYFVPTYLRGIVASRGVLTLCPHCRESYIPQADEISAMGLATPPAVYYRGSGCPACEQSGFEERRYLLDVIPFTPGVMEAFESARESREILHYLQGSGYRSAADEGAHLLAAGEVSPAQYVASFLM